VALLGYNAIQISLYGLVGVTLAGMFAGPWWIWAAAVWAIVALLGRLRGVSNAKILGTLLAVELGVIVLFDLAAFGHSAEASVSLAPLLPSNLVVAGLSGALAFSMAAFVGVEAPPAFGEEARGGRAVGRSTFIGIFFLGLFYLAAAWAYATAVGPNQVVDAARDPAQAPFAILDSVYGSGITALATLLLVTSIIAAMLSFHSTVSRYVFALAREGVIPAVLARVSSGTTGGAPLGGSLVQSVIAAVTVAVFVILGADPMTVMFTWLSTIGAVCILVLLVSSSLAALAFFSAGRGAGESGMVRRVFPTLGGVTGALTVVFMISNLSSLLGTPPGSRWPWLVPLLTIAAALAGAAWGRYLRSARPRAYAEIGRGTPNALTVQDQRLAALEV
jgi:amino acid transporter